jgi:Ca-activated chloride channel family protein
MPRPSLFLLSTLLASPLAAQGWIEPDRIAGPLRNSPAVVRVESNVRVRVEGRIARYEVTERFRNTGRGIAEGTYHYALPGEAVFSDFSLFQGEQELKGEMMNAEQARSIYEGIVRQLKDPALLTLVGHGLVRAQVFPIQSGETRTVILRYTQLLPRDGDAMRLRYAAGSRGEAPVTMQVEVAREADFATAYSPTHPIDESRRDGELRIRVDGPVRGDVELVLPFRRGLVGGTVITHAEPGDDGYALLFLAPPPSSGEADLPRDLTFVVDISGSMSGGKMEQARTALNQAIGSLRPVDRFRLIAFSSGVREFREGWSPVTAATRADARRFVDGLNANGGTNIAGALEAALSATATASRMSLIFFVTDGLPSVGEQQPDRIAANAAGRIGRHRVFTFGVGQDVNTYLLDRLAVEGRGGASYVAPEADVSDAVGGVLTKLSRPALVDLRIVSAPVRLLDQAPATLPDLFYGEELVILSRYRGTGSGPVVIEGTRNGRRERFEVRGSFTRHEDDNRYVPQLWAARRIGELTRQLRIEGSSQELIAQIRDLGLKHGILTEYTSYLVQEPGMLANREERTLPAAAPVAVGAQTGSAAFDAAKSSANMSGSSTLAEAESAVRQRSAQLSSRRGDISGRDASSELRRGGGRMFTLRAGVWTDVNHRDSLRVTTIAPFSRAYFDLVAARPSLREALAIGAPVLIAGRQVSLKVADGGTTTWAAGAMTRFLQEFDGR